MKDLPEGTTNFCPHPNSNESGICDLCLGKKMKNQKKEGNNYPIHRVLVRIDEIEYENGGCLYDLNYVDEFGYSTSDGLYDEVELIAKLLHMMRVVKQAPRFLMRNYARHAKK